MDSWLADPTTPVPEITNHPEQTTVKYGFGVNFEQPLAEWIGLFGRWGWNEGRHESYAYTEVDQTWQIGAGGNGNRWGRKYDRVGLVFVSNGISHDHATYLADGGLGFLLGDGQLNYARENILESFYTVHVWRGIFPGGGIAVCGAPGIQRGSRTGDCADVAVAFGILRGGWRRQSGRPRKAGPKIGKRWIGPGLRRGGREWCG